MKKIRLLSLLAVSALVLTATSCQDGSSTLPSSSLPSSISSIEPEPEEVSVTITNGDSASLFVGDTLQLEATVTGTDAAVTWSADMTNVITVSDTGLVTANAVGECTVTASVGDVSDSISITVAFFGESAPNRLSGQPSLFWQATQNRRLHFSPVPFRLFRKACRRIFLKISTKPLARCSEPQCFLRLFFWDTGALQGRIAACRANLNCRFLRV